VLAHVLFKFEGSLGVCICKGVRINKKLGCVRPYMHVHVCQGREWGGVVCIDHEYWLGTVTRTVFSFSF
jgi:hypothetical protein